MTDGPRGGDPIVSRCVVPARRSRQGLLTTHLSPLIAKAVPAEWTNDLSPIAAADWNYDSAPRTSSSAPASAGRPRRSRASPR